jgi:MtN3 and saliva related transmembrane protein
MASWGIEAIGLLAGFLGVVAWIPQMRHVWVEGRHDGISLPTFAIVTVALGLWLVYGLLVDSVAMVLANTVTIAIIAAIIVGVVRLRRAEGSP